MILRSIRAWCDINARWLSDSSIKSGISWKWKFSFHGEAVNARNQPFILRGIHVVEKKHVKRKLKLFFATLTHSLQNILAIYSPYRYTLTEVWDRLLFFSWHEKCSITSSSSPRGLGVMKTKRNPISVHRAAGGLSVVSASMCLPQRKGFCTTTLRRTLPLLPQHECYQTMTRVVACVKLLTRMCQVAD